MVRISQSNGYQLELKSRTAHIDNGVLAEYLRNGLTPKEIADIYHVNVSCIYTRIKKLNLVKYLSKSKLAKEDFFEYASQNLTAKEIAKLEGMPISKIYYRSRAFGIPLKNDVMGKGTIKVDPELFVQYLKEGKLAKEIAELFNVSVTAVRNYVERNNLKFLKKSKDPQVVKEIVRMAEEGVLEKDISKACNISFVTIRKMLLDATGKSIKDIRAEKMKELLNSGMSFEGIAEKFHIKVKSVIRILKNL